MTKEKNKNEIILRSVYSKMVEYYINPCPDARGVYPDCVKKVNSQGDMIMSDTDRNSGRYFIPENAVIKIEDGMSFDLNNEIEAATWEAIKNCPLIAPERFAKGSNGESLIDGTLDSHSRKPRYGVAELYVDRPGLEAERRVSKIKQIHNASKFILEDSFENLLTIARILGRRMNNLPKSEVEDFLLQIAEKNPERIITLYTGDNLKLRLLLCDALDKKIINGKDGLYIYKDNAILGSTIDAAIQWMRDAKNKKTLALIQQDTYPELLNQNKE